MAKRLSCRDAGVDCDVVICADTEEEIFQKAADHAKSTHHMKDIPQDLRDKVRSVIREVQNC